MWRAARRVHLFLHLCACRFSETIYAKVMGERHDFWLGTSEPNPYILYLLSHSIQEVSVNYTEALQKIAGDAQAMETLFRSAQQSKEESAFSKAADELYTNEPHNLLYAAWHYRFQEDETTAANPLASLVSNRLVWQTALILSVINGLLFWLLSDMQKVVVFSKVPLLLVVWAPIYAIVITAFMVFAGKYPLLRWILLAVGLALAAGYVTGVTWWYRADTTDNPVIILMLIHLPALALYATGYFVLRDENSPLARFAALNKAIETVITAGLFLAAGMLFTAITFGLFSAIDINPPEWVMRLFAAGGIGLVPVLAVAAVYHPDRSPQAQSFSHGLSRLIALVLRILLPLALVVAVVYVALIPFNFMRPFYNRETLIIYNVMLFAVLGLIVGATPVYETDLPESLRLWLRRGLLALASLALLVAVYAMIAVLYRTWSDGFTPNRVAVIGWNLVNIGILGQLLYRQWRCQPAAWLATLHETVASGLNWYVVWTVILMVVLPWVF